MNLVTAGIGSPLLKKHDIPTCYYYAAENVGAVGGWGCYGSIVVYYN